MDAQFSAWLRALSAAGKGPLPLKPIHRGTPWSVTMTLPGDWTGAEMRGQIRAKPDAPGLPLATFAIDASPYDEEEGDTTFTLSLTGAATGGLPLPRNGTETFLYDLLLAPEGGAEDLLFGGTVSVYGRITE